MAHERKLYTGRETDRTGNEALYRVRMDNLARLLNVDHLAIGTNKGKTGRRLDLGMPRNSRSNLTYFRGLGIYVHTMGFRTLKHPGLEFPFEKGYSSTGVKDLDDAKLFDYLHYYGFSTRSAVHGKKVHAGFWFSDQDVLWIPSDQDVQEWNPLSGAHALIDPQSQYTNYDSELIYPSLVVENGPEVNLAQISKQHLPDNLAEGNVIGCAFQTKPVQDGAKSNNIHGKVMPIYV